MLLDFLLLLTVAVVLGNDECDYLVMLNKGEVKELLSPSFPWKDDPGEICRWTVIAEPGRRIVLVCPFNEGSDTRTDKRSQCGAEFKVKTSEGGNALRHCRDKTFSRVGASNRMIITYKNDVREWYNRTLGFKCYLYAELKSRWDLLDSERKAAADQDGYGDCDFHIKLEKNDMVRLALPKFTEEKWSKCRWTAIGPQGSNMSITCPFTDKPPHPLSIQMVPCTGEFTVIKLSETTVHQCNEKSFSETSTRHRIIVMYESLMQQPYEEFECYFHAELPDDETSESEPKSLPYKDCDHYIELNETLSIKSPNYPDEVKPRGECRWTVVAPKGNRIALNCLFPNKQREIDFTMSEDEPCHGEFFVTLAGGKKTRHCQFRGFYHFSSNHEMIIMHENPSDDPVEAFECFISPEAKLPSNECKHCTGIEKLNFKSCDKTIVLHEVGVMEELTSPDYPNPMSEGSTPCRWTVYFPKETQVYLSCPLRDHAEVIENCKGYFTVYPTGYLESGIMYCSDAPFSVHSSGNESKMVVTYSGQPDLSKEPFKCNITAYYGQCKHQITLPRMKHYQSVPLQTPFWPTAYPPWPSCTWNYESAPEFQINLICDDVQHPNNDCNRTLLISHTGDEQFKDGIVRCLDGKFSEVSIRNKLSIKYTDLTETSVPSEYVGCNVYLDRKPSVELCNCGWSPSYYQLRNRRIIGGIDTPLSEFPMVAALVNIKEDRTLFCGATIISDRYALTAARCLANAKENEYEVGLLVGTHDLSMETEVTIVYHVDEMISYPDFNDEPDTPHKGDIGLVHVSETILFNDDVKPVCLPFSNRGSSFVNEKIISLGWGSREEHEIKILQKMEGSVEDDDTCNYFDKNYPDDEHICMKHSHENICEADSGGPMLWVDPKTDLLKVIGILFRRNGCEGHFHTKATEVTVYLDWIEENTPGVKFCKNE